MSLLSLELTIRLIYIFLLVCEKLIYSNVSISEKSLFKVKKFASNIQHDNFMASLKFYSTVGNRWHHSPVAFLLQDKNFLTKTNQIKVYRSHILLSQILVISAYDQNIKFLADRLEHRIFKYLRGTFFVTVSCIDALYLNRAIQFLVNNSGVKLNSIHNCQQKISFYYK